VILPIALSGVILFIVAGLAWTARLVYVGNLLIAEDVTAPSP
jgi:hypothetical protein